MKKGIVRRVSFLLVVLMIISFSSCSKVEVIGNEMIAVFRYGEVDILKQVGS